MPSSCRGDRQGELDVAIVEAGLEVKDRVLGRRRRIASAERMPSGSLTIVSQRAGSSRWMRWRE